MNNSESPEAQEYGGRRRAVWGTVLLGLGGFFDGITSSVSTTSKKTPPTS